MPIYEYTCRKCGAAFERRLKYEERLQPQACPGCGEVKSSLRMSAPALVGGGADASNGAAICPTSGQPRSCGHGGHHH